MGAIDVDLWKILAYRLQGTPLRGHGLLQSEIYSNIVVEPLTVDTLLPVKLVSYEYH